MAISGLCGNGHLVHDVTGHIVGQFGEATVGVFRPFELQDGLIWSIPKTTQCVKFSCFMYTTSQQNVITFPSPKWVLKAIKTPTSIDLDRRESGSLNFECVVCEYLKYEQHEHCDLAR